MYKVTRLTDRLKQYWYRGNISAFKYHLSLSDKYLVEAKTLFEYQQYLLAQDALSRSDTEFLSVPKFLHDATAEGKDTHVLTQTYHDAAIAHEKVLQRLLSDMPKDVTWSPEHALPTHLAITDMIATSLKIRTSSIQDL